jgi:hypothetical protein
MVGLLSFLKKKSHPEDQSSGVLFVSKLIQSLTSPYGLA